MITYLYWIAVISVSLFVFWGVGRYLKWKAGLIGGLTIFIIGWLMYTFHYEQHFVKNYGGVMSIEVPKGQVFVLGDNRPQSMDSRVFGPVDKKSIVGRAFVVIWPIGRWRWL